MRVYEVRGGGEREVHVHVRAHLKLIHQDCITVHIHILKFLSF